MEPPKKKRHIIRNVVLAALLAVFCISGVFLVFCWANEPALYRQITDPAVALFRRVREMASQEAGRLQVQAVQLWEDVQTQAEQTWEALRATPTPEPTPEPEEEEPVQAAAPPVIQETRPRASYTVTRLTQEEDQEMLTGGNVTVRYYNQADEVWAKQPFGPDTIDRYGCGPTAMSMVISSLTEEEIDPAKMAVWASEAGYCCPGSGSRLSLIRGASEAFGLTCVSLEGAGPETLRETLSSGGLIVALMGPGHFTQNGHFILLRGVTLSGDLLVADPNSRENSLTLWEPQLILDEASRSRSSGAPLWLITVPPEEGGPD